MARTQINTGDRFTDGQEFYTVVDWNGDEPLLLDEYALTEDTIDGSAIATMEWIENRGDLTPAPDAEASAAALAAYRADQQAAQDAYDARSPLEQLLFAGGTSEWQQSVRDDVARFHEADRELTEAQAAVTAASRRRAQAIADVNFLLGTQPATAKALGIDQSRVSRAIASLRES